MDGNIGWAINYNFLTCGEVSGVKHYAHEQTMATLFSLIMEVFMNQSENIYYSHCEVMA